MPKTIKKGDRYITGGFPEYDEVILNHPQTLTEDQQAQARANIGVSAGGVTGAVLYDQPLSLTEGQKEQARENIDAANAGELAAYAKKDGYYETLGAGYAKSLLGNGAATQEMIDFRPSGGGTKDIGTGVETIKGIRGNSVVMNQLLQNGDFSSTGLWGSSGCSVSISGGQAICSITSSSRGTLLQTKGRKIGHIYFGKALVKQNEEGTISIGFNHTSPSVELAKKSANEVGAWSIVAIIAKKNEGDNFFNQFSIYKTGTNIVGNTFSVKECVEFDLTQMFGAGNEPTSLDDPRIKWIESLGYIPYTAEPFLLNYKGTGLKTIGVNGEEHTLALPITTITGKKDGAGASVTIFPDGMRSAGSAFDYLYGDTLGGLTHAKKVIGGRAYQAGDEDDVTLVTDGTTTLYPLATPEDYILDQPINTIIPVENGGTETNLPQGKDESGYPLTTPLVAEIVYPLNLPKNYISKGSMDAILNAFKSAGIVASFTLTFNETTGKYDCSITKA